MEMNTPITKEFLEKILKKKVLSFKATGGTKPGDNFMSILISLEIVVAETEEPLHLLFKTFPHHPTRQKILEESNTFSKEFLIYEQMLPELVGFQKTVIENDKAIIVPAMPEMVAGKCIHYSTDDRNKWSELDPMLNNFILMVDARKTDDFQMTNKLKSLSYLQAKLVLKELAKFHALCHSYTFHNKLTSIRSKFPFMTDRFYCDPIQRPMMEGAIQGNMELVLETCTEFLEKNLEIARSLDKIKSGKVIMDHLENFLNPEGFDEEKMEGLMRTKSELYSGPPLKDQWTVAVHGDCWTNNILFKSDETGNPTACLLVDLQEAKESCVMTDLVYFMYTSTDTEFRNQHLNEMLEWYHQNFLEFCGALKVEPFPGFTPENFLRKFHRSKIIGFLFALFILPIILEKPENSKDMDSFEVGSSGDSSAELFVGKGKDEDDLKMLRDRFTALMTELHEDGIL